jgi:outer membrane protein OmpA-like peptidoglycan-associated protein
MSRLRVHVIAVSALLCALLCTAQAAGDTPLVQEGEGMEPRLFRPAVDTKGHFTVDSTPVLPHLNISLGFILDFGFNEWLAVEQDGEEAYDRTLVDRYIAAQLMFNLGLWDRVVVGLQLPIAITTGDKLGYNEDADPIRRGWSTKGTFSDIAIHAKFHITRANFHAVGIGAVIQYQAPSGKSELLTGEPGGGAVSGKLILDVEPANWYRAALNGGVRYALGAEPHNHLRWDGRDLLNNPGGTGDLLLFKYGPMLTFGLGQSFMVWPGLMDLVIEFYGNQLMTEMSGTAYTSLEAAAGFKFYVEANSYLLAGYAHGIPTGGTEEGYGFQNVEHRMFLGFAFEPSMPDRDGDGIADANDACPDSPEDRDGFEDSDGCPDLDNDKDGIPDTEDQCPLVPEDKDDDRDTDGCPEEPSDPTADRDNDRIPDIDDKCPDKPETYNGKEDEDGCPDKGDVILTDGLIKTLKKVYFEYNSDKIMPVSYDILDTVALTIVNNPQIDLIEVQGHADERGNERYNLRLTGKRAKAVVRYLVKKGVPKKKLRSMGYGEYCPVNQGHDEEAWEENRRVEFKVLKVNGQPTGVETACKRAIRKGVKSLKVK